MQMNLTGLSIGEVEESRKKNGSNELTQMPTDSLVKKFMLGFKDPMIMILLAALAIQFIMFYFGLAEWFEPVGVLIAIVIANGVSAISEYKQEGKASSLKADEEAKQEAKVLRDGCVRLVHVSEIVVGDIVFLQSGDRIAADGEIIDGNITVDQAALNGETEEAQKCPSMKNEEYDIKDLLNKNYVYRGTVVCSGEAYMKVSVVGDNTLFGKLALEVQENTRKTPLQLKLQKLAKQIATFGYIGAIAIVIGIISRSIISNGAPSSWYGWVTLIMDAVTVAVTIVVCAVPEGLPMLTSILLSLRSVKMAKDNVLVRKINGLETAGSLSLLFTDKTGTITEGRLSVTELITGDMKKHTRLLDMSESQIVEISTGIGINNSSMVSGGNVIGGNSTDRALMSFLAASDLVMSKEEVREFNAFDSSKKYSSVTIIRDGNKATYIKGAPERVLELCSHYIDENGNKRELASKKDINKYIDSQAARSMRLLAVAKRDDDSAKDLSLICILSIRDNVRREAVDAIREVQNAGIQVVMVTGDRKETAIAIAKESGLIKSKKNIALTSAELSALSDEEVKKIIPNLRVVARALPTDKSRLVRLAQDIGYVVGMTGDGVNDSPALKKADVGFAMGSGTEVAKEAGDITILDDNFLSIKKAILYGRTMFKSIRKFLVFQLTVNVSAVLTCFIGPLLGESVMMTVIQLLLINLVMDTFIAIAYGSEPALEEYMNEKPVPRSENIVNKRMYIQILVSAAYITLICIAICFFPPVRGIFGDVDNTYIKSAMFATFMMAITFNGFNARTEHMNPFEGLGRNKSFIYIVILIFVIQFIFVSFGGRVLSVEALTPSGWAICVFLAFLVIPIDIIRKAIVNIKK